MITSGIVDEAPFGFLLEAAIPVLAPISNAFTGFFITFAATFLHDSAEFLPKLSKKT